MACYWGTYIPGGNHCYSFRYKTLGLFILRADFIISENIIKNRLLAGDLAPFVVLFFDFYYLFPDCLSLVSKPSHRADTNGGRHLAS